MKREFLEVGPVRLDVVRHGEGQPLLLLHGEPGVRPCEPLLESLGERYEVVAPHHPGWGDSPAAGHITTVADIAELYHELIDRWEAPVPVVGVSLGGWAAAQLAATCSHRLRAVALVSPLGAKFTDRETRQFLDVFVEDEATVAAAFHGSAGPPARDPAGLSDDDLLYEARAEEAVVRYGWAPYLHDPKLRHRLRRINVPTLIVAGAEDGLVLDPDYFRRYADAVGGNATLVTLPGAGHRVEEERPDELAAAIVDFLDRAGSGSTART